MNTTIAYLLLRFIDKMWCAGLLAIVIYYCAQTNLFALLIKLRYW